MHCAGGVPGPGEVPASGPREVVPASGHGGCLPLVQGVPTSGPGGCIPACNGTDPP